MLLPDIWGQGQLFAFSALDGNSFASNDFVGMLSGDRLGVSFYSKVIRELAVVGIKTEALKFNAVTGDYISAVTGENEKIRIIYYDTHLVIGDVSNGACAVVHVDGKVKLEETDCVQIQDTCDGEYSALAVKANRFAFAFGNSTDEVVKKALAGLDADIDKVEKERLAFFEKHSMSSEGRYSKLYSKCLSVMKTQLYSPEGHFQYIWSTPDRLPHKDLWLWDSVFHALGFRHVDIKLAEELILDIFPNQFENGMIPHMGNVTEHSEITQPPVIAWGAWKIYEETGNVDFLRTVFSHNARFLEWCYNNRKFEEEDLFYWSTNDIVYNRCDESGIDNSPRFDKDVCLQAIDFACYMANDMRYMGKIAEVIGEDRQIYDTRFERIRKAVNEKLWDSNDNFYYDYDFDNNQLHKVESFCSFLPLFAGICDKKQASHLVEWLTDPERFYTALPVPSISKRDRNFEKDMWRSPVWINFNYFIIEGLQEYGYTQLADEFIEKTIDVVNEWYHKTGVIFEFFDCDNIVAPNKLNRKGPIVEPYNIRIKYQAVRDFGWSSTLTCDLIARKYGR